MPTPWVCLEAGLPQLQLGQSWGVMDMCYVGSKRGREGRRRVAICLARASGTFGGSMPGQISPRGFPGRITKAIFLKFIHLTLVLSPLRLGTGSRESTCSFQLEIFAKAPLTWAEQLRQEHTVQVSAFTTQICPL